MNYFQIYKTFLKAYNLPTYHLMAGRGFPPLRLVLELTYRCNLACPFCYQGRPAHGGREITFDEVKRLTDWLPFYSVVTLTGGEPLIRKDLIEIVRLVSSKRRCTLITNGSLLTEDHLECFVDRKLYLLGISLDAVGQRHDRIRGKEGLYAGVIDRISRLQEMKRDRGRRFPLIELKPNILDENLEELPDLFQTARSLGVDDISFGFLKGSHLQMNPAYVGEVTLSDLLLKREELVRIDLNPLRVRRVLAEIFKMADGMKKPRVHFYPGLSGLTQLPSLFDIERDLNDRYLPCYDPWSIVRVTAYGDMYPCLPFKIGNIRERPPKDLWNSVRYKAFRQWLRKAVLVPACERCCNLTLRTGAS